MAILRRRVSVAIVVALLLFSHTTNSRINALSIARFTQRLSKNKPPLEGQSRPGLLFGGGSAAISLIAAQQPLDRLDNSGIQALLRGGAAAATQAVTNNRPSRSTIIACFLALLLLRSWWNDLPKWLKSIMTLPYRKLVRVPLRKVSSRLLQQQQQQANATISKSRQVLALEKADSFFTESDDFDEAGDSIYQKLKNVMALAQSATSTVPFAKGFQLEATLLVMLGMVEKSKQQTAELWNDFYETSGRPLFDDDHQGLDNMVNANLKGKTETIHTLLDQLHWSDWAYLEETADIRSRLAEQDAYDWKLVRHVKANEPGRVGHFVAIDTRSKTALISVKGTSALSDMVTDACGRSVRYNITQVAAERAQEENTPHSTISCHEGILDASLALTEDVQPLVEELFLPAGYKLLLVGHSLGAGCAALLGTLLRSRIPPLRQKNACEVVAFAPPPILDLTSAVATCSFVTSIVNNDDMIPRTSLRNLVYLLRFLAIVDGKLDAKGMRPSGAQGTVRLLKTPLDGIMTGQEIFDGLNEAVGDGDSESAQYRGAAMDDMDHLHVPGKVVVLFEKLGATNTTNVTATDTKDPIDVNETVAEAALFVEESKPEEPAAGSSINDRIKNLKKSVSGLLDKELQQQQKEEEPIQASAVVADGAAPVLRHINVNGRMLSDHMPDAYEKTLRALL